MHCVKTGCHLFDADHGIYYRGDLYWDGGGADVMDVAGTYIFKFLGLQNYRAPLESRVHMHARDIVKWPFGDLGGVLIPGTVISFNYDGFPPSKANR